MIKNVKIKVCCNNMIGALEHKIIMINGVDFCLGNTKAELKKETEFDSVVIKVEYCPWCGIHLKTVSDIIKEQIEAKKKE